MTDKYRYRSLFSRLNDEGIGLDKYVKSVTISVNLRLCQKPGGLTITGKPCYSLGFWLIMVVLILTCSNRLKEEKQYTHCETVSGQ